MAEQVKPPRDKVRAEEEMMKLFASYGPESVPEDLQEQARHITKRAALTMVMPGFGGNEDEAGSIPALYAGAMLQLYETHRTLSPAHPLDGAIFLVLALAASRECLTRLHVCQAFASLLMIRIAIAFEKASEEERKKTIRSMVAVSWLGWSAALKALKEAATEPARAEVQRIIDDGLLPKCVDNVVKFELLAWQDGLLVDPDDECNDEGEVDVLLDLYLSNVGFIQAQRSILEIRKGADRDEWLRLNFALWESDMENTIDLRNEPALDFQKTVTPVLTFASALRDEEWWQKLRAVDWFSDYLTIVAERLTRHRRVVADLYQKRVREDPAFAILAERILTETTKSKGLPTVEKDVSDSNVTGSSAKNVADVKKDREPKPTHTVTHKDESPPSQPIPTAAVVLAAAPAVGQVSAPSNKTPAEANVPTSVILLTLLPIVLLVGAGIFAITRSSSPPQLSDAGSLPLLNAPSADVPSAPTAVESPRREPLVREGDYQAPEQALVSGSITNAQTVDVDGDGDLDRLIREELEGRSQLAIAFRTASSWRIRRVFEEFEGTDSTHWDGVFVHQGRRILAAPGRSWDGDGPYWTLHLAEVLPNESVRVVFHGNLTEILTGSRGPTSVHFIPKSRDMQIRLGRRERLILRWSRETNRYERHGRGWPSQQ